MGKYGVIIIAIVLSLLLIVNASALYTEEDNKISFGHPLRIQNISVPDLAPGELGILKVIMKNNAAYSITDVRARLTLPSQLQLMNDVNEVRVAEIKTDGIKEIKYRIIALPTSVEGIYNANLTINYITHFGVNAFNIGQNSQDNYSFGIVIRSLPSLFMQLDSFDVYKEKLSGDVTLKFVNNGTSDIKFLTVNLDKSNDYEILSDDKSYVGDLDPDDFQSVTFKIKVNKKVSEVNLPLEISYKDSMNNLYSQQLSTNLRIMKGSEIGKTDGISASTIILVIVVLGISCYFIYGRFIKKNKNYR